MSEVYYDISILIENKSIASELSEKLSNNQKACGFELINLINFTFKTNIDSFGFEYNLESLKVFNNEVQIYCYSGKSDPPVEIACVLAEHGAGIVKIAELHDEAPRALLKYFIDGKTSTKKKYEQQFKKYKIEDDTDKLQRFLSNHNFRRAEKIVDSCDLDRIEPEDSYLLEIILSHEYVSLAKKLLKAGLFDNVDSVYKLPWMGRVAQHGTTELLESFIKYGLDPYDAGEGRETALRSSLHASEKYSLSNIKCLIDHCSNDLDTTTEYGSPLWSGFEQGVNVPGCLLFEAAGAKLIPPLGFYDSKKAVDILVESIKYRDEATFKQYYTNEHYYLSLYLALRDQSFPIVTWLNNENAINWHSIIPDKLKLDDSLDQYFLAKPLYEIPFALSSGGNCDWRLLDFIIENMEPRNAIYNQLAVYIAGFNFLPESVLLLKKLKTLGARFDITCSVESLSDEEVSPLDQALLHNCIENLDYLLEIGATVPNDDDFESVSNYIKDYLEGETKAQAVALLKKHGLTS